MARIWEAFATTQGTNTGTRNYCIDQTENQDEALALLFSTAPAASGSLLRDEQSMVVEHAGPSLWVGRVDYRAVPRRKPLQPIEGSRISFTTGGGTQKIFQSKQTVGTFKAPSITTAPNFKGAINVTDDSVNGTDIVVRKFSFKVRRVFDQSDIDNTRLQAFYNLTGTVNNATFYGFPAESVLLLGVDGDNSRGDGKYDITLTCESSPEVSSLTVGDIVGISKKGHEYIWFRYRKTQDALANPPLPVMIPDVAYVERVYDLTDFSTLGFGVSL